MTAPISASSTLSMPMVDDVARSVFAKVPQPRQLYPSARLNRQLVPGVIRPTDARNDGLLFLLGGLRIVVLLVAGREELPLLEVHPQDEPVGGGSRFPVELQPVGIARSLGMFVARGCEPVGLPRSTYYDRPRLPADNTEAVSRIRALLRRVRNLWLPPGGRGAPTPGARGQRQESAAVDAGTRPATPASQALRRYHGRHPQPSGVSQSRSKNGA